MFPDNVITKNFTFGRTKAMYVANYGIAPHLKKIFKEEDKNTDCSIISFEENRKYITQSCQMDVIVSY